MKEGPETRVDDLCGIDCSNYLRQSNLRESRPVSFGMRNYKFQVMQDHCNSQI
jgi:hypothetical protein